MSDVVVTEHAIIGKAAMVEGLMTRCPELSKKVASTYVDELFAFLKNELDNGKKVRFPEFLGTMEKRTLEAGTCRNPQTGEQMTLPVRTKYVSKSTPKAV